MKNIEYILFDLDNTLLDFVGAARLALEAALLKCKVDLTDDMYERYKEINVAVWAAYERKEITSKELRSLRFQLFFEQEGISHIDPKRFNSMFIQQIVECTIAYDGVFELLLKLKQRYPLGLITNGLKDAQRPRLAKMNIAHYFNPIVVSDEIGVAKPDEAFFQYAHERLLPITRKSSVLVVGDNFIADAVGAMNFGYRACWVSHGREMPAGPAPDFTVDTVLDLADLLLT